MNHIRDINKLKQRIVDISYKKNLSHIGSCLTALSPIVDIYNEMLAQDRFVLSQGHAALALYVVLEELYGVNAEYLFDKHGVHPNRDIEHGIHCSSGSLGHGLPIAVGMALADRSKNVYCLISDGECAEGSIWEALTFAYNHKLDNLKVFLNANGYGAYDEVDTEYLSQRIKAFRFPVNIYKTVVPKLPFLEGLQAHYHTLNKTQYNQLRDKYE